MGGLLGELAVGVDTASFATGGVRAKDGSLLVENVVRLHPFMVLDALDGLFDCGL